MKQRIRYKITMRKDLLRSSAKSICILGLVTGFVLLSMIINGCAPSPQKKPYNVVLISLDTVRADALGYTGSALAQTPNIDRMAHEGFYFTQAVSTNSLTTPAHSSLLTGRYPTAHDVHNNGVYALPASETTLAEFLKEHGYNTAAHVGAFPVSRRFGLAQGFDLYDDRTELPEQEKDAPFRMGAFAQRSAGAVADSAIRWAKNELPAHQPFFLFLHFFDPHAPYSPPQEFIQRYGTSKEQRYAGEIAYVDTQIGRVLSALDELGVRTNTIFVVIGDHGESLGEHGEETHGLFIYDSTIRIPMLFSGGPVPAGASSDEQIGLIDIFPTVADLLGIEIPEGLHGRSFKEIILGKKTNIEDVPYYVESFLSFESFGWSPLIGLRTSSRKLIRAPRSELYDLGTDPHEEKNIYRADAGESQRLEEELTRILQTCTEGKTDARAKLTGEELEQLRSLGYITAGVRQGKKTRLDDPKDRVDLFRKMEEASLNIFQGVDVETSISKLKDLAAEDPENETLQLIVGQALSAAGREDEAERHFRSIIKRFPDLTNAYNELATLLLKKEKWKEAIGFLKESLETDPLQLELYSQLVHALNKMGRSQEAITLIERMLVQYPDEAILHLIRGEMALQAEDYATASHHFGWAHANDPTNSVIAQNYARALLMSGQADRAEAILAPFDRPAENDIEFELLYSQCLAQAGNLKEAMKRFERILSKEDRPPVHYFMGICFLKMGNIEEAKKHFSMLSPDDPNYEMSRKALEIYGKK